MPEKRVILDYLTDIIDAKNRAFGWHGGQVGMDC